MTKLKRLLVTVISVLICYILQCVLIPMIPHLQAGPNLMLVLVMSVGFLFGKGYGLGTGIFAGLLLDILGMGHPGFYILVLSWIGYLNGLLSEKFDSELIYVMVGLLMANELVFHIYQFAASFLFGKRYSVPAYLTGTVIPEFLLTLIAFLIIYGILIFLTRRWDLKINKGEVKVV